MSLKIAITGSTGMVGRETVAFFRKQGHTVTPFVRKETRFNSPEPVIRWDIPSGEVDLNNLEGHDTIIHLAGASIAARKWTARYKELIRSSRTEGTAVLAKAIAKMKKKPRVFLSASAIGYYGSPDVTVDENTPPAEDFLAKVCADWEKAAAPAVDAGVRTVFMRIGTVMGKNGGAMDKMLPIFRAGLGGVLGSGRQMMSWVALADLPMMMQHCVERADIKGPVNFVSPNAVSNREFTKILGKAIARPVVFPVPSFGLRLLYGEMADALLLNGANIKPKVLEATGYEFRYTRMESALEACLS